MRYIEGRDLKEILRDGVLDPERALTICGQVASALDAAHEQGLVHRDVKPSNILIDARDRAYLADFGLSRLSSDPERPAGVEASLGTIDYVAPEQIHGDALDGRADVYSLGCVLYQCLTGSGPFSNRSDVAMLYAHLEEVPPALPGLEQVMATALAKEPDDRYATCRELVEAATDALGVSQERRRRWPLLVVTAIAAVAVTAVVVSLVRGPTSPGGTGTVTQGSPDLSGRLIQVDAGTGSTLRTIPIGKEPTAVTVGAGGVWAASYPSHLLWKLDPVSGSVATIDGFAGALSLAATKGSAYAVFDAEDVGMERFPPEPNPPIKVVQANGDGVSALGGPDASGDRTRRGRLGPRGRHGVPRRAVLRVLRQGGGPGEDPLHGRRGARSAQIYRFSRRRAQGLGDRRRGRPTPVAGRYRSSAPRTRSR